MYDNPIGQIIALDKRARDMVKQSREHSLEEKSKISQNRQGIQKDYNERSDKHLDKLTQMYKTRIDEELYVSKLKFEENVLKLKEKYNLNHKEWEDTIFKRCLGK